MELLGCGREADVYAIDEDRVLRHYRRGDDASAEALLMAYLRDLGFPVPAVFEARGADLIMERLDGPTMVEALRAGEIGVAEGAAILAELHHRLHEQPPRRGRTPGDRILHRDLHPENVMLTPRGPVVIDWHNAAEGPPAVDVWLTAIILAQVAADPAQPHTAVAREFLGAFLPQAVARLETARSRQGVYRQQAAQVPQAAAVPHTALPSRSAFRPQAAGMPWAGDGGWSDDGLPDGLPEAMEIRRADPALDPDESARLAATVVPLLRVAAG